MLQRQQRVEDVVIVGAGPAGSAAAAALAAGGARVLLIEKQSWPRYKTCGGGVVRRAALAAGGALDAAIEHEACTAELELRDLGLHFAIGRRAPLVSLTMRRELDAELVRVAERAGARFVSSCAFSGLRRAGDFWEIRTSQRTIAARALIAADGVRSRVAGAAGWTAQPRGVPALEWELDVDRSTQARFAGRVRFDFGIEPHGYAWVFPKRQHLSVGILSTRCGVRDLRDKLRSYVHDLGLQPRAVESHGSTIPVAGRPEGASRSGVLLVGDAAGLVDPVTCEGISAALQSGHLAARALLAAELDPDEAAARYDRSLQREILPELRRARLLAKVLYGPATLRRVAFRRSGQAFCEAMGRVIGGESTYGALLGKPSNWLRALLGTRRRSAETS